MVIVKTSRNPWRQTSCTIIYLLRSNTFLTCYAAAQIGVGAAPRHSRTRLHSDVQQRLVARFVDSVCKLTEEQNRRCLLRVFATVSPRWEETYTCFVAGSAQGWRNSLTCSAHVRDMWFVPGKSCIHCLVSLLPLHLHPISPITPVFTTDLPAREIVHRANLHSEHSKADDRVLAQLPDTSRDCLEHCLGLETGIEELLDV